MFERRGFLTWSIASISGSGAGILLMNWLHLKVVGEATALPLWLLPAVLTATFQWAFCLRSCVKAFSWILLSTFGRFGFAVLWFWLWFFFERPTSPYGSASIDIEWYAVWGISAAVAGALLGLFQWFVLRRVFDRAGWWIFATAVGAVIAWFYKLAVLQFELSATLEHLELVANSHALPALVQGLLFAGVLRLKETGQNVAPVRC